MDIPEIANTWATYNHRLTIPDKHEEYDDNFKDQVETVLKQIENRQLIWPSEMFEIQFSIEESVKAAQKLKLQKSPGLDAITAEHIRYSGNYTMKLMIKVFSSITRGWFVQDHFKKGIKIPLFKGGGK